MKIPARPHTLEGGTYEVPLFKGVNNVHRL